MRRKLWLSSFVLNLLLLTGLGKASADDDYPDDARSPQRSWIGLNGGVVDGEALGDTVGLFGLDVGLSHTWRSAAVRAQADILPVGAIYRARGAIYLGYGTTRKYWVPCDAPKGYSCSETYMDRDVRTVVGLRLGTDVGRGPLGTSAVLEAGIGFHGQYTLAISCAYDTSASKTGGQLEFMAQLGSFYFGGEIVGFPEAGGIALLALASAGYTPAMW